MKPRTKYQKQVVTSNKGLRPIKGAQMQWAFRECLEHYAFQLKHGQTTCMDCGHTWTTDDDADKCVCPKCKAKLEVQRTKRQKAMSSTYFSVLTERKGLQLWYVQNGLLVSRRAFLSPNGPASSLYRENPLLS